MSLAIEMAIKKLLTLSQMDEMDLGFYKRNTVIVHLQSCFLMPPRFVVPSHYLLTLLPTFVFLL